MKIQKLFIVPALILAFLFVPIVAEAAGFSDVLETDWYYDVVTSSVDNGYIDGYTDGTFKPNNMVSYGEFYKMVAVASGLEIKNDRTDIHWAYPYADALKRNGDFNVISFKDGLERTISRKEAIRTLMLAFGINETVDSRFYDNVPFSDMPNPTIWSYDGHIMNAYLLGIVSGYDGKVYPEQPISRAEAVAIIERALSVENWTIPEADILRKVNVTYIGQYSLTFKNSLCAGLAKFPQYVLDEFFKDGGEIIITNEDPSVYYHGNTRSELGGLYIPQTNQIILFTHGKAASLFFDITGSLIHEMGHYMYYNILENADKNEIKKIFREGIEPKELTKLLYSDYCETNVDEFWAELICYTVSNRMFSGSGEISKSLAIAEKYFEMNK